MKELIDAYNNTNFTISNPSFNIHIGAVNPELNELLATSNATTWACITAYNSYSKPLSKDENSERHEQLKLKVKGYTFFEGAELVRMRIGSQKLVYLLKVSQIRSPLRSVNILNKMLL